MMSRRFKFAISTSALLGFYVFYCMTVTGQSCYHYVQSTACDLEYPLPNVTWVPFGCEGNPSCTPFSETEATCDIQIAPRKVDENWVGNGRILKQAEEGGTGLVPGPDSGWVDCVILEYCGSLCESHYDILGQIHFECVWDNQIALDVYETILIEGECW